LDERAEELIRRAGALHFEREMRRAKAIEQAEIVDETRVRDPESGTQYTMNIKSGGFGRGEGIHTSPDHHLVSRRPFLRPTSPLPTH
jgi:hypothetical protein